MSTKPKPDPTTPPPNAIKDSAQQIWLAGLGAFAKAQEEGSKMFESLVRDGIDMQRKTQAAAEEKLSDATHRLTEVASGLAAKAGGQWDKLESIFESRVGKALQNLGIPSSADMEALMARLDTMQKTLDALVQQQSKVAQASKVAAKKKTTIKKATLSPVKAARTSRTPRKAPSE